ncbi:DNA polymerase III beta subunit [hydrothermal vent metagenome]|uniref:DNA polymerase III beta subunit n=1 Tax=hydrothermal vent metagenome TaxID=652676 RepID=A0A3B1C0I8_9ZZZZ
MKIKINRDVLLKPLLQVGGVVERRQTLPILSNVLIKTDSNELTITATDLEVELKTKTDTTSNSTYEFTLPARKLIDICKALPADTDVEINHKDDRATMKCGRSRFTLSTLPAQDFPSIEANVSKEKFSIPEKLLKRLLESTQFAMAQQDVRYYLNGMLFEVKEGMIRTVATDGHRLALSEAPFEMDSEIEVILPRKAVMELGRLLTDSDNKVNIEVSTNHVRVEIDTISFTTKLIDGKYPDYRGVLPRSTDNKMEADREVLKQALQRTSILSNEKYRGIRFKVKKDSLELLAHNPEQEEAEEEINIEYSGDELTIGFNVGYLIDVLTVISSERVQIELSDASSSCLIYASGKNQSRYVVMPMRL